MEWECVGLALCNDRGLGAVLAVHAVDSPASTYAVCALGYGFDVEICGASFGNKKEGEG